MSPDEPRSAVIIWQTPLSAQGPPAIDENSVYFSTRDHSLAAVSRATGVVRWVAYSGISGGPSPRDTPVRGADVVVLGDEYLFGFEAATGTRRWIFGRSGGLEPRVGIYPFRSDGTRVYAGSAVGAAFSIDAATGAQVWRSDLLSGEDNQVRVVATRDGLVYGTLRYGGPFYTAKVFALDAETGSIRWLYDYGRSSLPADVALTPSDAPRQLLLAVLDDGRIVALDSRTGDPQSIIPSLVSLTAGDDRRMTVSGGTLVATTSAPPLPSMIIGYDLVAGTERWRVSSTQGSASPSLGRVANDSELAYITFVNGNIGAYELQTGRTRWVQTAPVGFFVSAPLVGHDTLFVAGREAAYAIRR